MKRMTLLIIWICWNGIGTVLSGQSYFQDNFDAYSVGDYLAQSSTNWTTWSGTTGGAEDVKVDDGDAFSDTNSIYFLSNAGNGPQDIVLDFGAVHSSGRFKFSMRLKIPTNKTAYFNFQGGANLGQVQSMECQFNSGGTFNVDGNAVQGNFPNGQWFEFTLDCNLDDNVWEVLVDGVSQGSYTNSNAISYLNLFPANANSEWWVDDVAFCTNYGCNPELALSDLTINPSTICSHQPGSLTVNIENNSSFPAEGLELGIQVGQFTDTLKVDLATLAGGADTTITISGGFSSPISGSSVQVTAINLSGDIQPNNDTTSVYLNVLPSPGGSRINKSVPFDSPSMQTSGTSTVPDIVATNGTLTYELTPPNGFQDSGFGTSWSIGAMVFESVNGSTVGSGLYSLASPSTGTNAVFSFTSDSTWRDSLLRLSFRIIDLNNGCDTFMTHYIRVAPRPVSQFSFSNVCDKDEMVFINSSTVATGGLDFLWVFGDGDSSTVANPGHTYDTSGTYSVSLYAISDFGFVDTSIQTVTVLALPKADFHIENACGGEDLVFTDSSILPAGNASYLWDFGDGNTSSSVNATHQYLNTGFYNVTLLVEVNGCSDMITKYATQAPRATPSFSANTQCNNTQVVFDNTTSLGVGSFGSLWKFGDGKEARVRNAQHAYGSFGSYDVTLEVTTNLGCVDSITQSINILESPHVDFLLSNPCNGSPILFSNLTTTPSGGSTNYTWEFGDNVGSGDFEPIHQYASEGEYDVKLIAEHTNGCSDSLIRTVAIDIRPIADFNHADVCDGEEVKFSNATINIPNGVTYLWDFGNGITSTSEDTSIVYGQAQSYQVSLLAITGNNCIDTAQRIVNVYELPDAVFIVNSGFKGDGTINFEGPVGMGYSYQWFMGDGSRYTTREAEHQYLLDGSYEVKLIVTSPNGCTREASQIVNVFRTDLSGRDLNAWSLYPNPAHDFIYFEIPDANRDELEIYLINYSGKIVVNKVVSHGGTHKVSLGELPAGLYVVRVTIGGDSYYKKLVIK